MATTWVDFKTLKTCIAIEDVIAHYGIQLRRVAGSDFRGRCPLPTHTSSRSRDSFSVNVARNVWSCRSISCIAARGGHIGGNVLDLVALLEGCSVRDAALRLQAWCSTVSSPIRPREPRVEPSPVPNRPLDFELRYINPRHPYLGARGLSAETVRTFGIGHYTGNGLFRGRVVIPIHDEQGALVAYAGRAIDEQQPKYRFPTGFRKSLVLFNLHRAYKTGAHTVTVVEGFFDVLTAHQAGFPAVVALMGSTLSRYQSDLLHAHFHRVLLMLDGDEAGRQGAANIASALGTRMPTTVITLDEGKQPDQLAAGDIQRLLTEARS